MRIMGLLWMICPSFAIAAKAVRLIWLAAEIVPG
jgi:hypothetical protein